MAQCNKRKRVVISVSPAKMTKPLFFHCGYKKIMLKAENLPEENGLMPEKINKGSIQKPESLTG